LTRPSWRDGLAQLALVGAIVAVAFPVYYAFAISTQSLAEVTSTPPSLTLSGHGPANYAAAWRRAQLGRLLLNSVAIATTIAAGKVVVALLAAFAVVFFDFRGRRAVMWTVLITLMLPLPARIVATHELISALGWLDSYVGLTLPLMASATAVFLFRQLFLTVPVDLAEAAQLDGAGPLRFLWSFLLPLARTHLAALFLVLFVLAWNQYLWPLMMTRSDEMRTVVIGIERLIPRGGGQPEEWNVVMAATMTALAPPVALVLLLQRWFVRGLVEVRE
jgi:sn-glycerol 3-phosphate transport system permease protein